MAELLSNELILFGFVNIIDQNRKDFRKLLSKTKVIKDLLEFQNEFQEFYNDLPSKKEAKGFSTEIGITYYDTRCKTEEERKKQRVKYHEGGDKQFIKDCKAKKKWMLEILKLHIEAILITPLDLSDFGDWNDAEHYSYFILKNRSILGCLSIYFNDLDKKDYPRYEDIYDKLVNILYQHTGKPYSYGTFKKTKERNTRNPEKKLQKAYDAKLKEAMDAQRNGNIRRYATLVAESEEILSDLLKLQKQK